VDVFRYQFADAWYDLHNPELVEPARQMVVTFSTGRPDFPPHLDPLAIRNVTLYFARSDAGPLDPVELRYLRFGAGNHNVEPTHTDQDGAAGIRRGNAPSAWSSWLGDPPVGSWELALPNTTAPRARFAAGEFTDILLVVTYEGTLPAWPS
jgi:hypothetical protein